MGTKQLAIRGVVFSWIGHFCAIAITFVLTPILVNGLGKETYGLWSVLMSLTGYYGLFNLGLRPAAVKYMAQYDGGEDHASVNKVLITSIAVYGILGFLVLPVSTGMAYAVPRIFDVAGESLTSVRWAVLLTGLNVAVGIWGQAFAASLTARLRIDLITGITISSRLLGAVFMVLALRLEGGLVGMAAATLLVGILTQLVQCSLAMKQLPHVSFSWTYFDYGMLKILFRFSILNLLARSARQSSTYAVPLIVGAMLGPVAVTYFSIADALVQHLRRLLSGVSRIVMPMTSQLESQKRHQELVTILVLVPRLLLPFALGMVAVFFFMGWPLIELWIGEGYSEHVLPVLCILAVGRAFTIVTSPLQEMMAGMNRVKLLSNLAMIQCLIVIVGGIGLIYPFGLIGMACAILLSQFLASGFLLPWYTCREIEFPFVRFLAKTALPGILSALPGLVLALFWALVLPAQNLFILIGQILSIGTIVTLSTALICLDQETRLVIYRSFRTKRYEKTREQHEVATPSV